MRTLRKLLPAWMLEQTGLRRGAGRPDGPGSRADALTKLKALFDSGVLTSRQYADERNRILRG